MKTFSYARINASKMKGITIETTNQDLLIWVSDEIKKMIPTCQIQSFPLHMGNWSFKYALEFSKLNDEDLRFAWYILSLMCNKGWQPMNRQDNSVANSSGNSSPSFLVIDLLLETEQKST